MSTQDQNKSQKKDEGKKTTGPKSTTTGPKSTIKKDKDTGKGSQSNSKNGR